jgi:site-specific recombinase XerD
MNLLTVFKQLLEGQHNKPSGNTVKSYVSDIRSFSAWYENHFSKSITLHDFSQATISEYLKLSPLSPNSKDRQVAAVKKMAQLFFEKNLLTTNPFPRTNSSAIPTDFWKLREFKHTLIKQKASPLTIKNYMSDIHNFTKWIESQDNIQNGHNISDNTISTYKNFLVHVLTLSPSSVNRKLSTIRKYSDFSQEHGYSPEIEKVNQVVQQPVFNVTTEMSNTNSIPTTFATDLSMLDAFRIDTKEYSAFAPVRIVQKMSNSYTKFEEHLAFKTAKSLSKLAGRKPKLNKKNLLDTIRHKRPVWYAKYHNHRLSSPIHIVALTLFCTGLIIYGYARYFDIAPPSEVLGISHQNKRVLVYAGKLEDNDGKILSRTSELKFIIYPHATANDSTLWEESHTVSPNEDGSFTVQLGRQNTLHDSFFTENQNLYLGITINSESELLPRQRLANVGYAGDTALLDGMSPITKDPAQSANAVLALDSSGNLVIGGTSNPIFQASGGEFTITGTTTLITSNEGSNGNIVLNPDGSGVIDIRKPIVNDSQDASASGRVDFADEVAIATESAGPVLSVENKGFTGAILSLISQNITRMLVDTSGNVGIGTSTPRELVHIAGSNKPSLLLENTLSGAALSMSVLDMNAIIGTQSNTPLALKSNDLVRMTIGANGNVGIGTTSPTALLDVGGNVNINGTLLLSGPDQRIQSANNNNLIIGGNSTSNLIIQPLITDGFVGISNANPQYKLDIMDSQNQKAVMQITNTSTSTQAGGLNIQLGNSTNSNQFISFQSSTSGVVGSITGGGSGVQYHTTAADFAEYFKKNNNENISNGSIVCLNTSGSATICSEDNKNILGVSSEKPGFVGGKDLGSGSVIVGLIGQVETYVSTGNGPIQAGDPITVSGNNGIGVKALNGGIIVGRALESFTKATPGKILVFIQPSWHEPSFFYNSTGEIYSTSIPDVEIDTDTYDQVATAIALSTSVIKRENTIVDTIQTLRSATIGTVKSSLINTQSLIVNGTFIAKNAVINQLRITSDNFSINGLHVKDYIASVISEGTITPSFMSVKTNFISPLSESSQIGLKVNDNTVEILSSNDPNASGSAVASIDNQGNATFSGRLTALTGTFDSVHATGDASVAGTLTANSIRAKTIEGIEETVYSIASRIFGPSTANDSHYIDVSTMSAEFALFRENLISIGTTTLREATVLDSFSIGTQMVFEQDSVNVLGSNFEIQPLRQGGVSFLGGLMALDTDGNLYVGNDAQFAKNVTIKGGLFASLLSPLPGNNLDILLSSNEGSESAEFRIINDSKTPVFGVNTRGDVYSSGSAQFVGDLVASGSAFLSKINIFSQDAQAVSDNELEASSSAGTAILKAYKREVTIKSPYVTAKSLIYITPSTNTGNNVLYLIRQSQEGSFTVGINESLSTDVQFNWIIVN